MSADDSEWRLIADLSVLCFDSNHRSLQLELALPIMVFYVFLPPLGAWANLRKNHTSNSYMGFLIEGFREDRYYWFLVIMARKVFNRCSFSLAVFGHFLFLFVSFLRSF